MKNPGKNVEYLQHLIDNVDFSIADHEFVYDKDGKPVDYRYLYVNDAFCKLLDLPLEEIIGKTVLDLIPDTEQFWIDNYFNVLKTGKPITISRYVSQFNKHFVVHAAKSGDNTFVVSFKDVTSILKSAQSSIVSKPKGKIMENVSKIGFFEVNRLNFKAEVSDLFCEVAGLEEIKEGFFRKTLLELTHPEDYDTIKKIIQNILLGEINELETEFRMFITNINKYHWMSFYVFAVEEDEEGIPFRYTGLVKDIEEEKDQRREFEEIDTLFKEARKVADLATFIYDVKKEIFIKSQELDDFTGVKDLTTLDQFRKIVHPEDLNLYDQATDYTLSKAKGKVTIYRIIKEDKEKFVQSSVFGDTNELGATSKVFGILKDITEIERARRREENSRQSFELIFNSSPAGIFLLNTQLEISMENDTFGDFLDVERGIMTLKGLLGESYDSVVETLRNKKEIHQIEVKLQVNGKEKYFVIHIVKLAEEFNNDFQGTLVDVTDRVKAQNEILYLATHDLLTGLYNRNYFEEMVVKRQNNHSMGLILCDVDGLKLINDAFGHLKGDELLQTLAKAIKNLSPDYLSARIGGDEFAVLIEHADEELLEKIELEIKESIRNLGLFGIEFEVSTGYAILNSANSDFNKVFNKAENMMYRRKLTERSSRKSNALSTIMQTLHEKTEETKAHCERVGEYSSKLLFEAGFKRNVDLDDIKFLSDVHDIGKIATPEGILNKYGKLTKSEYEEIKYHSEAGYKIIKNIIDNENIANGILYHHERFDGTGYPHGLKGLKIPLYARVLAIADSYDTMIRGRIYQKPISKDKALLEIERNKGTQFDPMLAEKFIDIMRNDNE